MSISLNTTSSVQTDHSTAHAIKTAQKSQSQQELEGEMAVTLIESANIAPVASLSNTDHIVDIKV